MITLITHNDLDGAGCAVLFRTVYGHMNNEIHYCDYGNVNETVKSVLENESDSDEKIIIADISVNEEVAEMLNNRGNVLLFDHHKTALWLAKYEWATVDVKKCGTVLLCDYFIYSSSYPLVVDYLDFVIHVNDYDMWIHQYHYSKKFNTLFGLLGMEKFVERMIRNSSFDFTKEEFRLVEVEELAKERYMESFSEKNVVIKKVDEGSMVVGYLFAERYTSELGNFLLRKLDLDMVVIMNVKDRKVSLRSVPNVDCSVIAKRFSGGGHKNASGFELAGYRIDDLTNVIFGGGMYE